MKIITWNCSGAFRNKFENLLALDADLLVIQEYENPKGIKDKKYTKRDWNKSLSQVYKRRTRERVATDIYAPKFKNPYHIDYCFASTIFTNKIKNVTVEPFDKWKHLSDYSPLIITFDE